VVILLVLIPAGLILGLLLVRVMAAPRLRREQRRRMFDERRAELLSIDEDLSRAQEVSSLEERLIEKAKRAEQRRRPPDPPKPPPPPDTFKL
jgi:hypothetical protein